MRLVRLGRERVAGKNSLTAVRPVGKFGAARQGRG
jgi:hypothetical protein